jgi:hypothetical protein
MFANNKKGLGPSTSGAIVWTSNSKPKKEHSDTYGHTLEKSLGHINGLGWL